MANLKNSAPDSPAPIQAVRDDEPSDVLETALDEIHAIADLIFEATSHQAVAQEYAGDLWAQTLHVASHAITRRADEARAAVGMLMRPSTKARSCDTITPFRSEGARPPVTGDQLPRRPRQPQP
jgi:hypothetical protein